MIRLLSRLIDRRRVARHRERCRIAAQKALAADKAKRADPNYPKRRLAAKAGWETRRQA